VGKGTVYAGQALSDVFAALHVQKDFGYAMDSSETDVEFVHRKLADGDIYFVDNRNDNAANVNASFRIAGKQAELWHAESGTSEPVSFRIADGRTTVPLHLEPWGTVFVVFTKATSETSRNVSPVNETMLATVSGSWAVNFEPGRGAPATTTMDKLTDWSQSLDPGVKFFSGIATYTNTVMAPANWFEKGACLLLDLGDVKTLAVVTVNGKEVGEAWHAPYRVDITSALKPGVNEIYVKVVNTWVNRLIGDEQPGATKITFTDVKPYKANSPLQASGLLGPVTVIRSDQR
jgi:hypothetical protein